MFYKYDICVNVCNRKNVRPQLPHYLLLYNLWLLTKILKRKSFFSSIEPLPQKVGYFTQFEIFSQHSTLICSFSYRFMLTNCGHNNTTLYQSHNRPEVNLFIQGDKFFRQPMLTGTVVPRQIL